MNSFIQGMEQAIKYKDSFARKVVEMFGHEVLKNHKITFEGISETGHHFNIPITEDMLYVSH